MVCSQPRSCTYSTRCLQPCLRSSMLKPECERQPQVLVYAIGHISGAHLNPAISLALMCFGKIGPVKALLYIISQTLGAIVGCALVKYAVGYVSRVCILVETPTASLCGKRCLCGCPPWGEMMHLFEQQGTRMSKLCLGSEMRKSSNLRREVSIIWSLPLCRNA